MESVNNIIFDSIEDRQYVDFLDSNGYEFKQQSNYLRIGDIPNGEGWILYISAVYIDLLPLLQDIMPVIRKQKAAAFFPKDPKVTLAILAGHLGSQHIGKVIGVIPTKGKEIDLLLSLRQFTTKYRGPQLHDSYRMGGNIYSAYYKLRDQDLFRHRDEWLGSITLLNLVLCQLPAGDGFYQKKSWPFGNAVRMEIARPRDKRITHGYLEQEVLKNDSKGKVSKVRSVLRMPLYKSYIMKEGEKHMSSDVKGRDITDRLMWQYNIHRELYGKIPIPKAVDLFEDSNHVSFVMEYIDGYSLTDIIDHYYSYCGGWSDLDVASRVALLKLLFQIVAIVETMHENGYIHRDISPENFLVDSAGKVVCIDLELAYNLKTEHPDPPYVYGTYGYMSPEQKRVEKPTKAQDVYSVAALMIRVFTGLFPKLLNTNSTDELFTAVNFLVGDHDVSHIISSCMAQEPISRMQLAELKKFLVKYQPGIIKKEAWQVGALDRGDLQNTIRQGLSGVGNPHMVNSEGLWVSKVSLRSAVENEQVNLQPQLGLHTGMGGPLHLLLTAHHVGWDLQKYEEYINRNFNFLITSVISSPGRLDRSLYHGLSGVALLFQQAVNAGWLSPFSELMEVLREVLMVENEDLTVANGLAGQGLALLQVSSLAGEAERREALAVIAENIISAQCVDGSWQLRWNGDAAGDVKILGFDHGIAGVIYFLLRYFEEFQEQRAFDSAAAGLRYMEGVAIKNGGHISWPVNTGTNQQNLWWTHGITGMCIPFIKAYEITTESGYKRTAEDVLHNHLYRLATPHWDIANGMAGLGQVYLSAYKAFGNDEWMERASWITAFFSRVFTRPDENSLSWIVDSSSVPTADLMSGSSGIVHYILRFFLPENINYPIIN